MADSKRLRGWKWDGPNAYLEAWVDGTCAAVFDDSSPYLTIPDGLTITAGGQIITAGGQTITAGGQTITAGGQTITAGGSTITEGGLLVTAGRIREVLTPADADEQNHTLSVAEIVGGIVVQTSVTGAGTVTTDTAVHIVAGSSGVGALDANGQTITCWYINDGDQTLTFAGGSGVTVADTGQTVAADEAVLLLFRRVSATAVTLYIVGA